MPAAEPEPEIVDADLVVPEPVAVPATRPASEVAVQAAAVAVAGASFVAGAGVVALLKNRKARKTALRIARGGRRRKGRVEVVGPRSFLVDVHFVDRR